ncbi:MAG TPA: type II secretion system F family protein [bacterium]|nr:type II secretion system F family protein [bacterium]
MGTYKYNAVDPNGRNVVGTIDAEGVQGAISLLKERGLFISEISENRSAARPARGRGKGTQNAPAGQETTVTVKKKGKGLNFGAPVIKTKSLAIVTRQLSTLLAAGLPLLRALRTIRDQQRGGPGIVLNDLAAEVEQGSLLSQAMAKHPKSFPRIYVAMVRAGETSGALDTVLNRLASFAESDLKLRGRIKAAMAYPSVILVVAIGIVAFIMLKIVPVFVAMFADFEAGDLPAMTRALIFLSTFLTNRAWLGILILVAMGVTYRVLYQIPKTRYMIDQIKIKLPVFGPLIYKTIIARFARTMATLISSGVPILTSFKIVEDTVANKVISGAIVKIHDEVREGAGITNPMIKSRAFPPMLTNMVGVGEETGALDSMLDKVADTYDEEIERTVEALSSMIEPLLIVFMGGIVGFIVIALFLPLIKIAMSMGS